MQTVRIRQHAPDAKARFPIEIESEHDGQRFFVRATTTVTLSDDDRQDLHWYLEQYLEQTYPPHPQRAARIEQRMDALGGHLFRDLFEATPDGVRLWARLCDHIADARVEIAAEVAEATAIPWELLRDPRGGNPLALATAAFVRVQSQNARRPVHPRRPAR